VRSGTATLLDVIRYRSQSRSCLRRLVIFAHVLAVKGKGIRAFRLLTSGNGAPDVDLFLVRQCTYSMRTRLSTYKKFSYLEVTSN
jgi:hypothetical protein